MEAKRLNFNKPLLSARRFSPKVANLHKDHRRNNGSSAPAINPSPSYKSELHSGPLRNPGTVPFVWEQIPGRPKDEAKTQKPPVVPNLPPGRILKPKKQDHDAVTRGFYVKKGPTIDSFKDSKKEGSHSCYDNDDDGNGNVNVDGNGNGNGDVSRENEKSQLNYGPNFLEFTDHDSEDDSDFCYDEHGNMSFKFCGLLPQFCLRGSIGILNPVPGLSVRTRLPISSANRTRVGSSPARSQDVRVAAYACKSPVKQQNDQENSQSHGISDNLNESSSHFVSEVNIHKKGLVSFKELLAQENEKADFENPTIEKTLYVDTVETFESDCKENDVDAVGISHIPSKPLRFDLVADDSKHDKEMITQTVDHKIDQKVTVSPNNGSGLPAPPPLPKSPSDSWLWRTLPSMNSKTTSLFSNHKLIIQGNRENVQSTGDIASYTRNIT